MAAGHRVACHWAEHIDRGEITPHEVAARCTVARDDDGLEGDPCGPASVDEVL